MVRISNKEIAGNKNIPIGLMSIYGIGRSRAEKIAKECNINSNIKVKELSEKQIKNIIQAIGKYIIEEKLKKQEWEIIDSQVKIGTYRGLRRLKKLPVNGQRTRSNARTNKGKRITVANKKKAPTAK